MDSLGRAHKRAVRSVGARQFRSHRENFSEAKMNGPQL
jgi:hypothetical protein